MRRVRILDKLRNRTARVRQHRWRMRPYRSPERHIVVGGSPRSGTTLFRRILDRHPSICCGPEMNLFIPARFQFEPLAALSEIPADELRAMFVTSASQGALIDAFATRYRSLRGKARWAEKTPLNVRHFGWILERFPEIRLVHVIRDGRDVVCSALEHPDRRWVNGRWVWEQTPRGLEDHAQTWVADTGFGMCFRGDPRYHELRYEDLAHEPERTLRDLCTFLDEPFDPALVDAEPSAGASAGRAAATGAGAPDRGPVFTSSIGRWERDLSARQLEAVLRICGDRLSQLGYTD